MVEVSKIIEMAKAEVGVVEYPPNSNRTKYGEWYGLNGQPWCCIFIEWLFRDYPNTLKKTASCTTLMNWFKQVGKYKTVPEVGDMVFFNFDKKPDNNIAKHIGIVIAVNNDSVITIEGNTSASSKGSQDNGGMVAQRTRKRDKSIVGYGRPNYQGSNTTPEKTQITRPTLRFGDKNEDVKYLHFKLRKLFYNVDANNDYFDSTTKQCVINFQATNYLSPDGVVGAMTWRVLEGK